MSKKNHLGEEVAKWPKVGQGGIGGVSVEDTESHGDHQFVHVGVGNSRLGGPIIPSFGLDLASINLDAAVIGDGG